MGAYCEIFIDNQSVWWEKNFPPPGLETVFVEADRYERALDPAEAEEAETDTDVGYRVSLRAARFRLALRGYSVPAVRAKYEAWREERQRPADEYFSPGQLSAAFYSRHSYDEYVDLLTRVVLEYDGKREPSPDEDYILDGQSGYRHAFPAQDPDYALAALLHSIDGDTVSVSMADLISGDVWDPTYRLQGWEHGNLIVVTEGRTDNEVLHAFVSLFYPDHARTMRFFDYDFRPQGGASNNVNLLKSLAAAGIGEPILAIFDNDTAGHKEFERARKLNLPPNMMVMRFPDIDLLRDYPTLGPTGVHNLDVNRSAGSIELYLGRDCLTRDGSLIPVRWTGYDESMRRYQGEIGKQDEVIESFRAKLRRCRDDPSQKGGPEWNDLRRIMEEIESAVLAGGA